MAKGVFVSFQVVKAAVSVEAALQRYGVLEKFRRNGDTLTGPCPIHGGENPTAFKVSTDKNAWRCFTNKECGGGNVLDLVAKKERCSIRDAALKLQEWFNVDSRKAVQKEESKPQDAKPIEKSPPNPKVKKSKAKPAEKNEPLAFELKDLDATHAYLKERGLTEKTIASFGLGYCRSGIMTGRIAIPLHNKTGQLIGYAGRWPGQAPADKEPYKFPGSFNRSLELFNLHRALAADAGRPLIVVPGFFDCMWLWQSGYERVVSILGDIVSAPQAEMIAQAGRGGRVLVLVSNTDKGRERSHHAAGMLYQQAYVRVTIVPNQGQSVDQLTPDELNAIVSV